MRIPCFLPLCCLLAASCLSLPASAQVYGRPVAAKPAGSGGEVAQGALTAVASLTTQNRGADALAVLKNSVDTGVIPSDHRALVQLNAQDSATLQQMKSGQGATPQQIMQIVSRLWLNAPWIDGAEKTCHVAGTIRFPGVPIRGVRLSHRGDDTVGAGGIAVAMAVERNLFSGR